MHYQGPAIIIGSIEGRKRQYQIEYNGKRYKRDISMLIPEQTMLTIDVTTFDVTDSRESKTKPKLHTNQWCRTSRRRSDPLQNGSNGYRMVSS